MSERQLFRPWRDLEVSIKSGLNVLGNVCLVHTEKVRQAYAEIDNTRALHSSICNVMKLLIDAIKSIEWIPLEEEPRVEQRNRALWSWITSLPETEKALTEMSQTQLLKQYLEPGDDRFVTCDNVSSPRANIQDFQEPSSGLELYQANNFDWDLADELERGAHRREPESEWAVVPFPTES